jgi:transaldolase
MIKVPATDAGYIAMEELSASGIPVNATLIFKKSQAVSCANAFKAGVARAGEKVDTVISIFVSRIDRALDSTLADNGIDVALSGVYNTADIYDEIESLGVQGCRALFASTGVKDDSLPAYYYVKELLAYNSVNTAPVDTIKSFVQSDAKDKILPISQDVIQEHFAKIDKIGVNFDELLDKQIQDGLEAFKDAFQDILESL